MEFDITRERIEEVREKIKKKNEESNLLLRNTNIQFIHTTILELIHQAIELEDGKMQSKTIRLSHKFNFVSSSNDYQDCFQKFSDLGIFVALRRDCSQENEIRCEYEIVGNVLRIYYSSPN